MIEVAIPIRFADVDSAGIVYYPRYFHFFHVAMEEYFERALGLPYPDLVGREREGLPTVRVETDFLAPLRYGDTLLLEVGVERVGETSVVWRYEGTESADRVPVVRARVVTVYSDLDLLEKLEVPSTLRDRIDRAEQKP